MWEDMAHQKLYSIVRRLHQQGTISSPGNNLPDNKRLGLINRVKTTNWYKKGKITGGEKGKDWWGISEGWWGISPPVNMLKNALQ
jgi:hypothetical protein